MVLTPDKMANICLVNKNLVDPLFSPLTSRWSWYSVVIKILGNFLKPFALSALFEYSLYDWYLGLVRFKSVSGSYAILYFLPKVTEGGSTTVEKTTSGIFPHPPNDILSKVRGVKLVYYFDLIFSLSI